MPDGLSSIPAGMTNRVQFGLRWQAKRDTDFARAGPFYISNRPVRSKAPSPLRLPAHSTTGFAILVARPVDERTEPSKPESCPPFSSTDLLDGELPQEHLALRVAQHRRFLQPVARPPQTSNHSVTFQITEAQIELSFPVTLFGSPPIPTDSFSEIDGDAHSFVKAIPKIPLGNYIAAFRYHLTPNDGFLRTPSPWR